MKNISEIQQELRALTETVEVIERELEEMKPKRKSELEAELQKITYAAERKPIRHPYVAALDKYGKKLYFAVLSAFTDNDPAKTEYVCRISHGTQAGYSAYDIAVMCMEKDKLDLREIREHFKGWMILVFDVIMLVHMNGTASEDGISAAAELAELLDIEKDDLAVISQLAAAILCDSLEMFQRIYGERLYCGFDGIIPEEWFRKTHWKHTKMRSSWLPGVRHYTRYCRKGDLLYEAESKSRFSGIHYIVMKQTSTSYYMSSIFDEKYYEQIMGNK